MSEIKHALSNRRRLSLAVVIAVVVFGLVTLVPFQYTRTAGYDATFAGIELSRSISPMHLSSVLATLGYEGVNANLIVDGGKVQYSVKGLPNRYAVREATAVLAGLTGFEGEPSVTPVTETVSGSLYAQVKSELSLDDFDIDVKGKTDEEIKTMILERLKERGCVNPDVSVERLPSAGDGEGNVRIRIRPAGTGGVPAPCKLDQIGLDDLNVRDTTKSDAEIKALIEQRLAAQGVTGASVSVTTNAAGKRSVRIGMGGDCK